MIRLGFYMRIQYYREIICRLPTCIVNRVFNNSRGYVTSVELTPAHAPAISDGEKGSLGGSPVFGVKALLTVSKANSCREGPLAIV